MLTVVPVPLVEDVVVTEVEAAEEEVAVEGEVPEDRINEHDEGEDSSRGAANGKEMMRNYSSNLTMMMP